MSEQDVFYGPSSTNPADSTLPQSAFYYDADGKLIEFPRSYAVVAHLPSIEEIELETAKQNLRKQKERDFWEMYRKRVDVMLQIQNFQKKDDNISPFGFDDDDLIPRRSYAVEPIPPNPVIAKKEEELYQALEEEFRALDEAFRARQQQRAIE